MSRSLRRTRRAVPVVSLAAASVLAATGSAQAEVTCPAPATPITTEFEAATGPEPGCRIIFTESTSWTAPDNIKAANKVLLVGGGGGGGTTADAYGPYGPPYGTDRKLLGGGGGAGGRWASGRASIRGGTTYTVTVGAGGAAGVPTEYSPTGYGVGKKGGMSSFSDVSADGGPGGGVGTQRSYDPLEDSGGGGGSLGGSCPTCFSNSPNRYGGSGGSSLYGTFGPGGDVAAGSPYATSGGTGGIGGTGIDWTYWMPGLEPAQLGGGGGGWGKAVAGAARCGGGTGGSGGSAFGGSGSGTAATDGAPNTGGGGGGGRGALAGGAGGSGIVVLEYTFQASSPAGGGGAGGGGAGTSGTSGGSGGYSGGSSGRGSGGGRTASGFVASSPRLSAAGSAVSVSVTAPRAGTAVLTGVPAAAPNRLTCSATRTFATPASARMNCVPGVVVQRLRRTRAVRVKMVVAFRPAAGGATETLSVGTVTLPRVAARPIAVTG